MAIGNSVSASALVDAEQISLTGDGVVDLLAEANLEGGEGSGWAAPTDDIQTSMLSWIRIPHIPAHSEKTIYLIRFSSEPIDIANPFTELIKTGSPSSGQMLISEFYRDKIDHNPIADENVLIAERAHLSPDNPIPASDIYAYTTSNAANMFFRSRDANNPIASVLKRATAYDEYGSTSHILDYVYRYSVKMWTWQGNDAVCSSKNKMALTGYAWARLSPAPFQQSKRTGIAIGRPTADLKPENTPIYIRERFTGEYPYLTWQIEYMNGSGDWVQMMNLGRYTYVGAGITDLVCLAVSWEQSMIGGGLTIRVGVLVNGIYRYAEAITGTEIELDNDMALRLISSEQGDKLRTLYGLRVNETIRNEWQMLNVLRFMPLFNTEGIGAYDTFYANDNAGVSYLNSNTTITTIIGKEDTRPGRIQWGSYGAMPDLNEYSINEDIMGITPIKSFQPTDEHNTILVFTKNNTAVLALLGNSSKTCTVTRQLTGVGLVSRKGLCVLNNGVAWLSQQGIMVITSSGIVNISRGVINTSSITSLRYDHDRNWIWARTDEAQTYVYQSDEKVWWEYNESSPPDDFMGCINNQYGWISYEDRIMYKDGSDPSIGNRATLIKTRAVSMIKKLGRVKLIGNLTAGTYSLRARMFSNRITGIATETAEFTTAMNGRTAIPGVGADYVQLDLKGVNNIVAVAIEYEDGVR
jgi:hypothetical protein